MRTRSTDSNAALLSGFRISSVKGLLINSQTRPLPVSGFGFRVSVFGIWDSGVGIRVSGFGFRDQTLTVESVGGWCMGWYSGLRAAHTQ